MMERMGQVIAGRFELLAPIARGGQGTVWLAVDRRIGRRCAAKVLDQADSASLLRFVREQGVQVDHAHLASPYGWAAEDHEVAIAMPLVAGGSLEGALSDWGALGEPLTAALLLQLLDGLAELHGSGWIHRDVKPANVLLDATGSGAPHLRLGDMGLAMRDDDPRLTSLGYLHGTPGYVPPEAYTEAAPAPAQDLFAAGVTALRMLDPGCRPRDVGEIARVLAGVQDAGLRQVLTGLVADDPDARVRAAAQAPTRLAVVAAAGPGGGYVTASGEPFEVFDQLEGLDEEFGSAAVAEDGAPGPAPAEPETETRTVDLPPQRRTSVLSAPGRVEASAEPAPRPIAAEAAPAEAARPQGAHARAAAVGAGASGPGAAGRGRYPLLAWSLVGAGVLAVVVAVVMLLGGGGGDDPGDQAPSPPSSTAPATDASATDAPSSAEPSSDVASSEPTADAEASAEPTDGSGAASSEGEEPSSGSDESTPPATGQPSPDAPATPRSTGRPNLTSSVREGQGCIPAEHGTEVIGLDEQHLMCTWTDGAYSWTVVQD
ncbi:protein kinase domain-containing protein [Micrococcus lylae]|uniref:protein kinase domain-containing protein n=1 Tax=Micrococcus lylae TaxID=1273 RepID=UPI003EBD7212